MSVSKGIGLCEKNNKNAASFEVLLRKQRPQGRAWFILEQED